MTTTIVRTLTENLELILTKYPLTVEEREIHLKRIIRLYTAHGKLRYRLDESSYLILSIESRETQKSKRYPKSPFPLLSNVEVFSTSIGSYNEELLSHGIKSRGKLNEPLSLNGEPNALIYISHYTNLNLKCNKYLRQQYKRLSYLRSSRQYSAY